MISEKTITIRTQTATDGSWLYQDQENGERIFSKRVCLGASAKAWAECTDAEKNAWEQDFAESHGDFVQEAEAEVVE